jgi:RNA polymerase sigma factor (TIGR02999 family)
VASACSTQPPDSGVSLLVDRKSNIARIRTMIDHSAGPARATTPSSRDVSHGGRDAIGARAAARVYPRNSLHESANLLLPQSHDNVAAPALGWLRLRVPDSPIDRRPDGADRRVRADEPSAGDSATASSRSSAIDARYSLAYEELRKLSAAVRRSDGFATVTTTALVNEAGLKLCGRRTLQFEDERHFKRIVVRAMHQVLVDSARRRRAARRGAELITVDDSIAGTMDAGDRVMAVDEALQQLASMNERRARVVEVRFFGGLDVVETAQLLGISESTVQRDWRMVRAWYAHATRVARVRAGSGALTGGGSDGCAQAPLDCSHGSGCAEMHPTSSDCAQAEDVGARVAL